MPAPIAEDNGPMRSSMMAATAALPTRPRLPATTAAAPSRDGKPNWLPTTTVASHTKPRRAS